MSQFIEDLEKWCNHLATNESEMIIEAGLVLNKFQLDLFYQARRDGLLDTDCPLDMRKARAGELILTLRAVHPEVRVLMGIASYIQYAGISLAFQDQQPIKYITDGKWREFDDPEHFHNEYLYVANKLDHLAKLTVQSLERDMSKSMIDKERSSGLMSMAIVIFIIVILLANLAISVIK